MKFENFLNLMDTLLGENGCPWDKEQTHESLRPYLLEECYETLEAIDSGDMAALREELGDMLLQVVFHAKLAEKAGGFTIDDVIAGVCHKLTSRHSHIFGEDTATSAEDVLKVWEANKKKERRLTPYEAMAAVPRAMPALMRASKVVKIASEVGEGVCVEEVVGEVREYLGKFAVAVMIHQDMNDSAPAGEGDSAVLGDMLLKIVSLSNALGVNAELALAGAVDRVVG